MAEHTQTPWTANGSAIETVAEPAYVIGSVYEGDLVDIDSVTADANAAFIVRACNAHDDLIAALKDARAYVHSFARFNEDKWAASVLRDIDAALAKAGA